ncbi:heme exporter protein CcmD [Planktotalea sp.]|uniref:heme exporter protein CcmD n=1 Tax=Planktotalea sp. TaxID=2029877 RepID=UPI003D6AE25E
MMPDLGKYAEAVLSAYGASIVLLIALVAFSVWQAKRAKAALEDVESRRNG